MCRKLADCLDDIEAKGLRLDKQIGTAKICFAENHDYYWVGIFNSAGERCGAIERSEKMKSMFPIVDKESKKIVAVMLFDGVAGKEKLDSQKEYLVFSLKESLSEPKAQTK